MELIEYVMPLAGVGSFAVAAILALTYRHHLNIYTKQVESDAKQTTLDSAHLVLELEKQLRSEEFREVLSRIRIRKTLFAPFTGSAQRIKLRRFLNYITMICGFHHDGLLSDVHMARHYDPLLIDLDDNDWIHGYLNENKNKFPHLWKRLQVVRKDVPGRPHPLTETSSTER